MYRLRGSTAKILLKSTVFHKRKTVQNSADFRGVRHAMRVAVFSKQPNPPLFTNKKAHRCEVLFCWWRGCDSFNSAGLHLCKLPKRQHRKVVRHAKRAAVFFEKQPNLPLFQIDKSTCVCKCFYLGGEGWIRTTEVTDNRFTVCSLWPLGNLSVWSW